MANPQCENGYTKIANELLEAICKYITNPSWLRIGFLVIRLTYGWGRKEALINLKSLATKAGLTEEYVKSVMIEMELSKILKKLDFKKPYEAIVSFNKDYTQWKTYEK